METGTGIPQLFPPLEQGQSQQLDRPSQILSSWWPDPTVRLIPFPPWCSSCSRRIVVGDVGVWDSPFGASRCPVFRRLGNVARYIGHTRFRLDSASHRFELLESQTQESRYIGRSASFGLVCLHISDRSCWQREGIALDKENPKIFFSLIGLRK